MGEGVDEKGMIWLKSDLDVLPPYNVPNSLIKKKCIHLYVVYS